MAELTLEQAPLNQAARKAADFYVEQYKQEMTTAKMQEILEISNRHKMVNSSFSRSSSSSSSSSRYSSSSTSPSSSKHKEEEQSASRTENIEVKKGTNTGWVMRERARHHNGSIRNVGEAINIHREDKHLAERRKLQQKQKRAYRKHEEIGIFTSRFAMESRSRENFRPEHASFAEMVRSERTAVINNARWN